MFSKELEKQATRNNESIYCPTTTTTTTFTTGLVAVLKQLRVHDKDGVATMLCNAFKLLNLSKKIFSPYVSLCAPVVRLLKTIH